MVKFQKFIFPLASATWGEFAVFTLLTEFCQKSIFGGFPRDLCGAGAPARENCPRKTPHPFSLCPRLPPTTHPSQTWSLFTTPVWRGRPRPRKLSLEKHSIPLASALASASVRHRNPLYRHHRPVCRHAHVPPGKLKPPSRSGAETPRTPANSAAAVFRQRRTGRVDFSGFLNHPMFAKRRFNEIRNQLERASPRFARRV